MTAVLLVRHGETAWNRERRVQGWAPTALTDRGHEQALATGAWLTDRYDPDRVVSSDLRRTRETTARLGEAGDGLPTPELGRSWRERSFGVYQGFLADELFARNPDHGADSVSSLDVAPEGGESLTEFCDRVERAWTGLLEGAGADETVLVVTHGGVIKATRGLVTGQSRTAALERDSPPNCSVTEVALEGGDARLVRDGTTDWRE